MAATTEERLAALEKEIAEIKAKISGDNAPNRPGVIGRTRPDFLENYTGRSENSPLFENTIRWMEAEREKEREEANRLYEDDEAKSEVK